VFQSTHLARRWDWVTLLSPEESARKKRRERRILLQLEELETRAMLSASGLSPAASLAGDGSSSVVQPLATVTPQRQQVTTIHGFTPQQIQQAYGVPSTINGQLPGTGETIAIVDASYDPNIAADLAAFDKQFGLKDPTLSVVTSKGQAVTAQNGPSLGYDSGWAMETALDVEWAHSIAPGANIVLVEVPVDADNTQQLNDLVAGVQYAATAGNVVSMSWGLSEFPNETQLDKIFQTAGNNVTFVAASGDSSAFFGPIWPATSPYVLAVGGTSLRATTGGGTTTYNSESGWFGSGGGFASFEGEPNFQTNNPSIGVTDARLSPDVAFDANPSTGVAVYDSFLRAQPWVQVGGTSLGSPAWAGIVALADQQRGGSLDTYQVQTTLYNTLSNPSTYNSVFHEITRGFNGYAAGPGYNLVTGLGTPIVNNLVPLLANTAASAVIPSNFLTGSGTAALSSASSSPGTSAGGQGGGGLFVTSSGPTLTAPAPVISAPLLPIVTPVTTPSALPIASVTGLDNVLVSSNLSLQGVQTVPLSSSLNLSALPATPSAQANIVFGASGWNRLNDSLRMSSLGLPGLAVDQATDDLAGPLFEVQSMPDDGSAAADESPALDQPDPTLIECDAGDGSE
jgi:subtilase family serine protease